MQFLWAGPLSNILRRKACWHHAAFWNFSGRIAAYLVNITGKRKWPQIQQTKKRTRCSALFFYGFLLLCLIVPPQVSAQSSPHVLKSASELDYPPFALVLPDGQADGFAVELLKEVTRDVGLDVTFKIGPWNVIKQELKDGKIDVLPFVSYSKERAAYFDFTAPYLRMHGTIFVRKDNTTIKNEDDLWGKEVAVMKGDTAHEYIVANHLSEYIIATDSYAEALKQLSKGQHDAVVVQQLVGWQLVRALGIHNLKDVKEGFQNKLKVAPQPLSGFEQKFCIAVQKGNAELLRELNEGLAIAFSSGKYDQLYTKWFSPILPELRPSFGDIVKNTLYILIPLLAIFGTIGLFYFRREFNRRTKELRDSETRFKVLHNASFGGIFIHDKGIILDCNHGLSDITGYPHAELIGMDCIRLIAAPLQQEVREKMHSGYEKSYNAMAQRKNGVIFPVRIEARNIPYQGRPVRVVEFRDITELKQAEDTVRRSEEHLRSLAATVPGALYQFKVDRNGLFHIPYMSEGIRLFGNITAVKAMKNAHFLLDSILPEDKISFEEGIAHSARALQRLDVCIRFLPQREQQSGRWARAVALPMIQIDGTVLWNGILLDVTEQKESEEALAIAKYQAEAANKSKSEFLANMSHEIRTPLNGVVGMLQLLQATHLDTEQQQYAHMALQSSLRLTRLLSDILDLSMVEAGKLHLNWEEFDLPKQIHEAVELFHSVAKQSKLSIHIHIDESIPLRLKGDPVRVQQILINLIGNALKFTKQGEVSVSADQLPFHHPNQVCVLFSVADTGIGISDDKLADIFSPFTQGVQGYSRDHQGAGLGLAICQRLISLMGGGLAVETESGKGAAFMFSIPFDCVESSAAPHDPVPQTYPHDNTALHILLVEDDETNSMTAQKQIEKFGFHVTAVSNGKEALQALQETEFDVILMDIQMPVMNGVEATLAIRRGAVGEENSTLPIIAMTAYAMPGDKDIFLTAGMDAYLAKPIDMQDLNALLSRYKKSINRSA
ncbi:transporter substrate-binding domain-containing protein [Desulfovibrio inopinatus]|uniref:transporter substrate-binding domain-containing protein n=1 Tax=Desulfovibrio inopinatus TaxID=102109 RepID=UPI0004102177|nr:transporter substrate-binding domain-containing protein [Desulfovibrio inopinatus]